MRIAILAAGAAGMICGSCLRDNALALALRRLGHEATLVPLYTPLKLDTESATLGGGGDVYYGGLNVYLQHASWLFRHTPRFVDWLLDRPGLLRAAGNMGAGTPPAKLAGMTKAMIRGSHGAMAKELSRLIAMLRHLSPDVISLPNLMFAGIAETLRAELKRPVVVELTGEDIFLEAMTSGDQADLRALIRGCASNVAGFVATSDYYATKMAAYLELPAGRIATVYPGVAEAMLTQPVAASRPSAPYRIGHLARIDPPKGLDVAHAAVDRARALGARAELHYAGWEGPHHRKWHQQVRAAAGHVSTYHGEVDLAGKIGLLDSVSLLLAPAPYAEPKGLYVIEAMARGVPVIAANHGAFPELLADAGVLITPGDVEGYAQTIVELLRDQPRRNRMAQSARDNVAARFTDRHMAEAMLAFYASVI